MAQNIQIFTKQTKYWPNMTPIIDQTSQMWAKCCIGQPLGKLDNSKLGSTQQQKIFDTDMLPGSYPHRKYIVCMLGNIIKWR